MRSTYRIEVTAAVRVARSLDTAFTIWCVGMHVIWVSSGGGIPPPGCLERSFLSRLSGIPSMERSEVLGLRGISTVDHTLLRGVHSLENDVAFAFRDSKVLS